MPKGYPECRKATTWEYFLTFSSETKILKITHSAASYIYFNTTTYFQETSFWTEFAKSAHILTVGLYCITVILFSPSYTLIAWSFTTSLDIAIWWGVFQADSTSLRAGTDSLKKPHHIVYTLWFCEVVNDHPICLDGAIAVLKNR